MAECCSYCLNFISAIATLSHSDLAEAKDRWQTALFRSDFCPAGGSRLLQASSVSAPSSALARDLSSVSASEPIHGLQCRQEGCAALFNLAHCFDFMSAASDRLAIQSSSGTCTLSIAQRSRISSSMAFIAAWSLAAATRLLFLVLGIPLIIYNRLICSSLSVS